MLRYYQCVLRAAALLSVAVIAAGCGAAESTHGAGTAPAAKARGGLDGCVAAGAGVDLRPGRRTVLHAAVLGTGELGVVLSNQSDRNLCAWLRFARVLERAGDRVLVYDYASQKPWVDTIAAVHELRRLGARRVVLVGASEGAKASIVAGVLDRAQVDGVVALSPELAFEGGPEVEPWSARLRVPALFVVARDDPYAGSDTPILYSACGSRNKTLISLAGQAHGIDLLAGPTAGRVQAAILHFLARHR